MIDILSYITPDVIFAAIGGFVGLGFFEGLRIYKCTTVGKPPVPLNHLGWHFLGLFLLTMASVSLAVSMATGNFVEAVVLGFSVPSGIQAVTSKETKDVVGDDKWADENNKNDSKPLKRSRKIERWWSSYFSIRK